jgi:hypothetical protein
MKTCGSFHDEICFEGNKCPLCEDINRYDNIIEQMQDEIDNKDEKIRDLEHKLKEIYDYDPFYKGKI